MRALKDWLVAAKLEAGPVFRAVDRHCRLAARALTGRSMRQTGHRSVAMVARYVREAQLFDDNAAAGIRL